MPMTAEYDPSELRVNRRSLGRRLPAERRTAARPSATASDSYTADSYTADSCASGSYTSDSYEDTGSPRRAAPRRKVERRRQIDPTTCERDYSDDEVAFMRAMDEYKRKSGRMFPTWSEVLEVLVSIGYRKVEAPQETEFKVG